MPFDSIHSIQIRTYLNTQTHSKNEGKKRVKYTITYSIKYGRPQNYIEYTAYALHINKTLASINTHALTVCFFYYAMHVT